MSQEEDSGQQGTPTPSPNAIPAIPADGPIVPGYFAGGPPRLVTLRHMGPTEAELAKAKLESEGIPCALVDTAMAVTNPLVISSVRLQVREADVQLAEEILSRPAADDGEGDYADETWRCPKCHRRTVEMLPLPRHLRRVRTACLMLLALALLPIMLKWVIPLESLAHTIDVLVAWAVLPWCLIIAALGLRLIFARRGKRCTQCGHQWDAR